MPEYASVLLQKKKKKKIHCVKIKIKPNKHFCLAAQQRHMIHLTLKEGINLRAELSPIKSTQIIDMKLQIQDRG